MYGMEARLAIHAKMAMITDIRKTACVGALNGNMVPPFETMRNSEHHTLERAQSP